MVACIGHQKRVRGKGEKRGYSLIGKEARTKSWYKMTRSKNLGSIKQAAVPGWTWERGVTLCTEDVRD
eukprot:1146131-Pelagomonas_calceolata.AAC.2